MEEQNKEEKLDKFTQQRVDGEIKKLEEEKELKLKWRKEIENNKEMQQFFSNYRSNSIESFINSYINEKFNAYKYGDMYIKIAEQERTKWIDMAHDHLAIILQKQLFDLQCLWRADEIKLEDINISYDFKHWEDDIFNCPFLKTITTEDIKMYQAFLEIVSFDFSEHAELEDWQDYDQIIDSYETSQENEVLIPLWYHYHYTQTNSFHLLSLPNNKGEKEEFYSQLWFNKLNQDRKEDLEKKANETLAAQQATKNDNNSASAPSTPISDSLPFLNSFDKKLMIQLFKDFEDNDMFLKYKYYKEGVGEGIDNSRYEELFAELLEMKEPVPVEENSDIRDAVQLAYDNFLAQKVIQFLPTAHEQYLFNINMGLSIKAKKTTNYSDSFFVDAILNGRELNGETRDFNY